MPPSKDCFVKRRPPNKKRTLEEMIRRARIIEEVL